MRKLKIFCSHEYKQHGEHVQKTLVRVYDMLDVRLDCANDFLLPIEVYNDETEQYDAEVLLEHLASSKKGNSLELWITERDLFYNGINVVSMDGSSELVLYYKGRNSIFGYAVPNKSAILSTYRLPSQELVVKEAVHEVGHILGLQHCKNSCVMQYSNSLDEAVSKPIDLCDECKRKLSKNK